jgi:hypothetical protein
VSTSAARFGTAIGIALALVVGASCGNPHAAQPRPTTDPYAVYLANNPNPSLVLSREDAQARALLGCSTTWAPGTIDAVLHAAYAQLCKG